MFNYLSTFYTAIPNLMAKQPSLSQSKITICNFSAQKWIFENSFDIETNNSKYTVDLGLSSGVQIIIIYIFALT